ncbi:HAMP domain-containing sensor histidine kinase [Arthrobacter agilis]|uniref:sensor histidine kinase n=1 Tax=Arthrobacter agilis TaxID=37921 RepID=UPI0023659EAB|nr:HAMP domain-containing sensor histidine kinase [Arthrobacter agilis]WDF34281.1 HAMP domain-containing sensor histidine kinase [Arthrobacter agilis]
MGDPGGPATDGRADGARKGPAGPRAPAGVTGRATPPARPAPGSGLSRRRRIVLSELALTITFTLTVVLGLVGTANLASPALFVAGWALNLVVLATCLVLPWHRIPSRWVNLVPLADFVAIAVSRAAAGEGLTGVGLLAAFPTVWIAASRVRTRTAVGTAVIASLVIIWLPFFLGDLRMTLDALVNPILLPVMMTGLAAFVSELTKDNRRRQETLRASQSALRESVEAGRRRERLLGTVLDTVGVGLLALDERGNDLLMNARQRDSHTAAAPPGNPDPNESELLIFGADRETPVPPQERPVARAVQGQDLHGDQVWIGSGRAQRALSVFSHSMYDDDGTFAGTVVSFNDVTELLLALEAKDDFLSNVSHEFRTPLTSILGYLEVSLELAESLPEDVTHYLEVARRNALRLEQLVEDLLAINAGTFAVNPEPTDVGLVLAEAADSGLVRATRAGLHLVNQAPRALTAVADPVRLGQALDNLLSNAVKYNRPGGSITLDASMEDEGLTVRVEDTGIGIAAEELDQVFDRFFRSPSARASTVPGVGLGLLITRSIVSEHGGSITVRSEPGRGTCFTIVLPQPAESRTA